MEQCYNRGCGQLFDPATNTDESCRHHPGEPFFHDAYKGWGCCNKKSVDFTEFLNIKGCTLSQHSNVKPPEPEKPVKQESDKDEVIEVRAPIKEALPRPPIETPLTVLQSTVAPALKALVFTTKSPADARPATKSNDSIEVGTSCKNNGCTYSFMGTSSDYGECTHHPGVPIFHEGMKFWSCCQKRTSDFAQFMAQKGCVYGQHVWVKENEDKKVVQCRYDWHQTATNVVVAIYAKKYHPAHSVVEVNPIRLHVNLVFPEQENARFDLDLELRGIVDVSKASAQMLGTKVEITLPKLEPGSWSKLNFPRDSLPAARKSLHAQQPKQEDDDSDEDFDLDDIHSVASHGLRLSDLSLQNPNKLD
ncbi:cysteine and histidine-rich domain-containing protein morgana [Drosophila kikkawai]|uniref:Cysteine and histidine-rich domain-containing protein morgana n=1 Tax=Drosophila kikkawai TaxID=30033 RepID=A0A6P4J650_DROKI|nr:cysteine and histidine-rich domain-containing protein [Drosophila kikkawai]